MDEYPEDAKEILAIKAKEDDELEEVKEEDEQKEEAEAEPKQEAILSANPAVETLP